MINDQLNKVISEISSGGESTEMAFTKGLELPQNQTLSLKNLLKTKL